jgi:pyruvate formate lyase activating enzyme
MDRRCFLRKSILFLVSGGQSLCSTSLFSRPQKAESLKEALSFRKRDNNLVQCELCFRRCLIPEGGRGFCRVRENLRGNLYSLVYGKPSGLQIDPIELEPMYPMVPGHKNICVYTASCNFRCKHCHNWRISQSAPEQMRLLDYTPKEIVEEALRQGCQSISHSINEPTVFYE